MDHRDPYNKNASMTNLSKNHSSIPPRLTPVVMPSHSGPSLMATAAIAM